MRFADAPCCFVRPAVTRISTKPVIVYVMVLRFLRCVPPFRALSRRLILSLCFPTLPGRLRLVSSSQGPRPLRKRATLTPAFVRPPSPSGKSTVGTGIAQLFGIPYVDGDTLHSEANIAKMGNGIPLQDEDRVPWVRPAVRPRPLLLRAR